MHLIPLSDNLELRGVPPPWQPKEVIKSKRRLFNKKISSEWEWNRLVKVQCIQLEASHDWQGEFSNEKIMFIPFISSAVSFEICFIFQSYL